MSVNSTSTNSDANFSTCDYINFGSHGVKMVVLLPLCSYVLCLGCRRWRRRRPFQSHSDLFTFHLAAMELFWIFGFFCMICYKCPVISDVGNSAVLVGFYGEIQFHVLTCVERYLAVVHPVTYHGLKSTNGFRLKVLSVGGVWLLSFGLAFINLAVHSDYGSVPLLCLLIVSISATSACNFYALCALIRPRPGLENSERVDRSKQKAFHTIVFLWTMLCLWFLALLLQVVRKRSPVSTYLGGCMADMALNALNLCSSLVLPLLFLHREGKIPCIQ